MCTNSESPLRQQTIHNIVLLFDKRAHMAENVLFSLVTFSLKDVIPFLYSKVLLVLFRVKLMKISKIYICVFCVVLSVQNNNFKKSVFYYHKFTATFFFFFFLKLQGSHFRFVWGSNYKPLQKTKIWLLNIIVLYEY